jgi:hypothetical protein
MREEGQALPGWREPERETDHLAGIHRELREINRKQDDIMGALEDLQAANAAEQAELTTFLADIAAQISGGVSAADAETVVSAINERVVAMQAADPANVTPPAAPTA